MVATAGQEVIDRRLVAVLAVSASTFVGITLSEDYVGTAMIPTKNDRPTVGFGSTFREDGTPVQMGDKITPPKALARTLAHIQKDEVGIKKCVTSPLSQREYDVMVDFAYQYGVTRLCGSVIVREANKQNYEASCKGYLEYKKSGGFDCSIPGNRICAGVWERNKRRYNKCLGIEDGQT